jgi:hypothetical protein
VIRPLIGFTPRGVMAGGQVNIRAAVSTNVRVTPASQMMLRRPIHASGPASDAVLTQRGQEDQRIYRALHTLNTHSDCSSE